ncbi:MAG: GTP pyrophosphokinase family protein [Lachnospiraceae bacterium]|nr:GTP pyrophosphokinase family protein [Lachnospiraceae bacterium]
MDSIYGSYEKTLQCIAIRLNDMINDYVNRYLDRTGDRLYEHLSWRIKSPESMADKCRRENLPLTPRSALRDVHDAIGIRIVCLFIDDIYRNINELRRLPGCRVIREKDYISEAKPNGYRSYHLILEVTDDVPDVDGHSPGRYYAEIQLRTIAMDTWAALEHELRYKKNLRHPELISDELRRCAAELAACDVSLQTIRELIRKEDAE